MDLINFFRNFYTALQTNQFSKKRLAEIQEQRFRVMLQHAIDNSEFYQDLYKEIDIENCQLRDLPVLTKSVMMTNFDHLVTDSRLNLHEIQEWIRAKSNYGKFYLGEFLPIPTSGSSGEYAMVLYHRKAIHLIQASLFARHPLRAENSIFDFTKFLLGHLFGAKNRIATIAVPYGNLGCIVKSAPALNQLFAKIKLLSLFDPLDQLVTELNEFQPHRLTTNSFFLAILAQEQISGNLNIAFRQPMSFLAGAGEPLTEHTKTLAQKAWNIRIQEAYGAAECYFMASSCQKAGNLHAMSDLCILEVVDGDYNPVPQGQYGEKILLTNLFNFTQPIIRYEIEDIAGYAAQSCECGLSFPTLLPLQGRTSDFFFFEKPNGGYERFHPYRFRVPLFYAHKLRQYQIVQTARNDLAFYYVPQNSNEEIEEQLRKILGNALEQAGLHSRVTLTMKQVETISRDEQSGKFKIIKSLGPPSDIDTALDTHTY
jgi:phenylacetate-coenzyme A ligase PaaK-like adenylate-forming protein